MSVPSVAKQRLAKTPEEVIEIPGNRVLVTQGHVPVGNERWPQLLRERSDSSMVLKCLKNISEHLNRRPDDTNDAEKAAWVRLHLPVPVTTDGSVMVVGCSDFEHRVGVITVKKSDDNSHLELYFIRRLLCDESEKPEPILVLTVDLTHRWSARLRRHC